MVFEAARSMVIYYTATAHLARAGHDPKYLVACMSQHIGTCQPILGVWSLS